MDVQDSHAGRSLVPGTDRSTTSSTGSKLAALDSLPARLDDATLTRVEALALAPLRPLPPIEPVELDRQLLLIMTLPKQTASGVAGAIRAEAYAHLLKDMPAAQVEWMVDQVLRRCEWLPAPAKCLAIAEEWHRADEPVQARWKAEALARRERQARLADTRERLRTERCEQDWIDALPERTKAILETEGLLRRCDDCGSYAQRDDWRQWQEFLAGSEGAPDPVARAADAFPSNRERMEA